MFTYDLLTGFKTDVLNIRKTIARVQQIMNNLFTYTAVVLVVARIVNAVAVIHDRH